MKHRTLLALSLLLPSLAQGQITSFDQESAWLAAAGPAVYESFYPGIDGLIITDQFEDEGALFTDGDEQLVLQAIFHDFRGVKGNGNITIEFTEARRAFAVEYVYAMEIELYSGPNFLGTSQAFQAGSVWDFGGVVSDQPFDRIVLRDWMDDFIYIDSVYFTEATPLGVNLCDPAVPNSSGQAAEMVATGFEFAGGEPLTLRAEGLPSQQFGYFLVSSTTGFTPNPGGSQGNLCLAGNPLRYASMAQSSGPQGRMELAVDTLNLPGNPPTAIQPGETWTWQLWFRDWNPMPTSNFSNAVSITFN